MISNLEPIGTGPRFMPPPSTTLWKSPNGIVTVEFPTIASVRACGHINKWEYSVSYWADRVTITGTSRDIQITLLTYTKWITAELTNEVENRRKIVRFAAAWLLVDRIRDSN